MRRAEGCESAHDDAEPRRLTMRQKMAVSTESARRKGTLGYARSGSSPQPPGWAGTHSAAPASTPSSKLITARRARPQPAPCESQAAPTASRSPGAGWGDASSFSSALQAARAAGCGRAHGASPSLTWLRVPPAGPTLPAWHGTAIPSPPAPAHRLLPPALVPGVREGCGRLGPAAAQPWASRV